MDSPEKKKFIAYDAYEKLADAYAERIDTKPHNAYLEKPATLSLIPDVKGKRVLDAGCGPGAYSEWLVSQGADVIAIDASPRMVEHARERLGDSVEVRLHDLRNPLYFLGDGSVDTVLASLVMDYIEDWTPVFREFRRVLKNDGVLVFSVGHPSIDYVLKNGVEDYFKVERVDMWWTGFGVRVLMPSYRRPLESMTNALYEAGFLIERIIEPRPTSEYKEADPQGYEEVSKRPSFICIKAIASVRAMRKDDRRKNESEFLFNLLLSQFGDRFSPEESEEVRKGVERITETAEALRSVKLKNGDEPFSVFKPYRRDE